MFKGRKYVISFNEFLNESAVDEKLKYSVAKRFMSADRNEFMMNQSNNFMQALENTTPDAFRSKNKKRLYIPADDVDFSKMTSFVKLEIEKFFEEQSAPGAEYKITDYIGNRMLAPKQRNEQKIGKILKKLGATDLAKNYEGDPLKDGAKLLQMKKYIVLSNHPYDVAGMSTDRSWKSCMDLNQDGSQKVKTHHTVVEEDEDGDMIKFKEAEYKHINPAEIAANQIEKDVMAGTIVAYLITENDMNIERPLARILLKPYQMVTENDPKPIIFFPEQTIYGIRVTAFREKMIEACTAAQEQLSDAWEEIWLKASRILYNDYATPQRNQNLSKKEVDKKELFDPENAKLGDSKWKEVQKTGMMHLNRKGQLI